MQKLADPVAEKSLHVEVAGSTPMGPQEGMTTKPPTQVQPSSVLLAEIERHKEGGPTVPPADDAICPMEEDRDHDMKEADDDPNQYFNTTFDNDVTMSQPYEYEMHVPEPERPRECKKSFCSCNPRKTYLQIQVPPKLN